MAVPTSWNPVLASAAFALVVTLGCGTEPRSSAGWQIVVDGAEDRIQAQEARDRTVFEVTSPRGIGSAALCRLSDERPTEILLRLRLQGLEELRFEYDSTTVVVSVSTTSGAVSEEVRIGAGMARRLGSDDPHWIAVRPLGADGTAALRPKPGGWIEVRAPEDFVQRSGREFRVRWIDFYR